ncbi:YhgE/Pip domain-containing protein [Anoxybacillus flavithermus]|uniref:Predicted membrane protein n=1 Tax=Anoxybacillus flavithermus (strain DSM 21510 / WK1) TaxID=491915 RepID=B7GF01_ANOFW|nr:YhgE/Pip domain-containing protein [Anoxybacillus flavithermus]ACJ34633.1 Predicted membrane protein [Anoxybacillus flavithermus WK1]
MPTFQLFIKEIKAITSNRKVLIPVIAVLFIPLLYSGMFLWAFWDPYEHLDDLPVAVVNNDKGATFEGEELHIGDDLVDKLKEKKQFDWHFVSQSEGEKGLKEQRYYMLIEIPEDFSENATTLQDDHPKKLQLIYKPNEGFNFLSAQIGGTAVEKIKTEVAKTLTETYAENMFESVRTLADGLTKASDGAKKLHDGLHDAKDGTNKLYDGMKKAQDGSNELYHHLATLAEKSIAFTNGLHQAADGSQQVQAGVQTLHDGMTRMVDGQGQLVIGAKQAKEGTEKLASGADRILEGTKALDARIPQFLQGSEQLSEGTEKLATSLSQWQQGATQVQAGATQVTSGLEKLVATLDTLIQTSDPMQKAVYEQLKQNVVQLSLGSKQVENGVAQLNDGAKALQAGATSLSAGAKQLHEGHIALDRGVDELLAGQQQLSNGAHQLANGQDKLVAGMSTLYEKMQEAEQGVAKLADGGQTLVLGLQTLADGADQLQDGAHRLADGSQQLSNGMSELTNGTEKLQDGMKQLTDGSAELADKLREGAEEAGNVKANEDVYNMFAEPVKVKNEKINEVPNYGTGFTPYFLSLGLFVGALLLSIVFPLREPAAAPRSPFQWFFAKFGVLIGVGIFQALFADSVLLFGLDLQVESVPLFILFSVVTSITFLSVIQFLVTVFGDPGRFIAIIALILQLTTSAGTFPLELIPRSLQHFNAWLPMTYSVFGFKAVISSGDFSFMWENVGKLCMFIVVMIAGTMTYFTIQHRRQFTTIVEKASEA